MPRKTDSVRYVFEVGNGFDSCPQVFHVGCEGVGAFVLAALRSIRNGAPGFIPHELAEGYGARITALLTEAGFWAPHDDGYVMVPCRYWRFKKLTRRADILASLRASVYSRDGHRCVFCGSAEDLTLDHIHPKSKGGPDTKENLQTLCRPCNSSKGARI